MNRFLTPPGDSFEHIRSADSAAPGIFSRLRAKLAEAFRKETEGFEHLVHLALNEAEALALQTSIPQLVFPLLASEKLQRVAVWASKQRRVQGCSSEISFAA